MPVRVEVAPQSLFFSWSETPWLLHPARLTYLAVLGGPSAGRFYNDQKEAALLAQEQRLNEPRPLWSLAGPLGWVREVCGPSHRLHPQCWWEGFVTHF